MKRLLLILGVLVLLLIAGITVFVLTFDADRYRPLLVDHLTSALGRPVSLERLSLGWRNGIALTLQGLAIQDGPEAGAEPLIRVESLDALVSLPPLLRKRVDVSSVVLRRPRVRLVRAANGRINLTGLAAVAVPPLAGPRREAAAPAASSGRTASVGETAVSFNVASLHIEDGTLVWTDEGATPPTSLELTALTVTVKNIAPGKPLAVEAQAAFRSTSPNVRIAGRITPPSASHEGSVDPLTLTIQDLPIEDLVPPSSPGAPQLRGRLTATLNVRLPTLDQAQWLRSIIGDGELRLADGSVANLNLLREVFGKFSMFPGLIERLEARLPQEYHAKLAATDTKFEPVALPVRYEGGTFTIERFDVRTDSFGLSGRGTVGINQAVNAQALLRIDPQLSGAIIRSVEELRALTTADGRMEIPLTIEGPASRVAVRPDLTYIASKVIVTKAVDLLGEFLRGDEPTATGEPQPDALPQIEQPGQTKQPGPPESPEGALLRHLLKKALE